ncbi:L-aspartate oxidase [Compostimonas suwonensis]|nr:L-aspartate oxidase [Compostimonas suwonensis]
MSTGTVIVVGSGIAGLVAAVRASRHHEVTLVTKAELAESNTRYAQGGIAAALFDDDSVASHVADTLRAGAGLCTPAAVEVLCGEGPERVRDLIRWGVEFDRDGDSLARGLEAAHSSARVLHAGGDATGSAIETALVAAVRQTAVRILENTFLRELVVADGRVTGVDVIGADGRRSRLLADAVVLATGGAGQLFPHTTNPTVATGDGTAAALRAGAAIADSEFYQFHPTALAIGDTFLVSEAVRGEGAVLRNEAGERFMLAVHPDAELAPRDVVARGIAAEMARQGGRPVVLDATVLGAGLAARFPGITAACLARGIDWTVEPVPVTPAAHYWMGGVATDVNGRTSLPGLWAVGEVACTGAHGANRLASNSLLESIVFAWRAADDLDGAALPAGTLSAEAGLPAGFETPRTDAATEAEGGIRPIVDRAELQRVLWDAAGLSRSAEGLLAASARLAGWRGADPATATTAQLEDANLLDLARVLVTAALAREESRGAHERSDFPLTDPALAVHLTTARAAAHNTRARQTTPAREVPVPC